MKCSDLLAVVDNQFASYMVYDYAGEKISNVGGLFVNGNHIPKYLGVQTTRPRLGLTLVPLDLVRVNERRQLIEIFELKERVEDAPTLVEVKKSQPLHSSSWSGAFSVW